MEAPKDVTIAVVAEELPAADAYARRHGWSLTWLQDDLVLLADGTHPADQTHLRLQAKLDSYRAVAARVVIFPAGCYGRLQTTIPGCRRVPGGVASIFHSAGVICARLIDSLSKSTRVRMATGAVLLTG